MLFRYSRWDGSQHLADLDADDLLAAMSDDLMSDGDLWNALRRMFQRGLQNPQTPGLQNLMDRLRKRRQEQLDRYDLGSALEDIKKKLDEVISTERKGIERQVPDASQRARKLEPLDQLPPDPAGRIKLLQQMLQPFMQNMKQSLQNMSADDLKRMREMLRDLNQMLRQRAEGDEPDFDAFKQKWGQNFPGVESLDELLEQLGRQAGQLQSLLDSMSPGQRRQLQEMMSSLFMKDERLEAEMYKLAIHLDQLDLTEEFRRRYDFRGDDDLSMQEAMKLMDELQKMEELERQLRRVQSPDDLNKIDPIDVEKLLGEESAQDLERLKELTKKLEEAGYLERKGDRLELTARAIRKLGDKALKDIFATLKRDRFGRHQIERRGAGGDPTDEAKRYEFGDPFLLDLKKTLMNAVERNGAGTPVQLSPDDFEVLRTELSTQASTVVMLDMSRSMINNGYFLPAKKVALALTSLIRGQFPRDNLYILGFSLYAKKFKAEDLPKLTWSEWNIGTNMHHGFQVSRQLLGRQKGGNKQIIMITDGEPTAHMEGLEADFSYPPTRRTFEETLKEVQRCTREGITINTFMLEQSRMLTQFIEQLTRINRGRAFFASPERLGEYILVDYVRNKRRAIA